MKKNNDFSIRHQLLAWLLLPLCALSIITTTVAYFLSVNFVNEWCDRELLNSADSVAARLRSDGKKILVDLPPAALAILRHTGRDKLYYQVIRTDGSRISGDAMFPGPYRQLDRRDPVFRYLKLHSRDVRVVRIPVEVANYPEKIVLVQVAETLENRQMITGQILLSVVVPQVMLILLGIIAVSTGVSRGLSPLMTLADALAQRTQYDLTHVSEKNAPKEVRPLVNAINHLLTRVRMDIEFQQRFVANAAHQLRTPLAGLKTYIYAAKRLPSDRRMNAVLDKIESGTDRMSRLVNQLLSLAKAEPANQTGRQDKIDLNLVVSEVTATLIGEAQAKGQDLTFEGTPAPALISGNPGNISELATNLVENAIIYSPEGGNISVRIERNGNVMLSVHDDGPGIPPEEQDRVFERFYRVLGTETQGSGLGLAIVKEIAVAHDAKLHLDSSTEKGTTIVVEFPDAS